MFEGECWYFRDDNEDNGVFDAVLVFENIYLLNRKCGFMLVCEVWWFSLGYLCLLKNTGLECSWRRGG